MYNGVCGGQVLRIYYRSYRLMMASALVAVALSGGVLSGCEPAGGAAAEAEKKADPVFTVETTTAQTHPMQTTVSAQGNLVYAQGASARVAATVTNVAVRIVNVQVREGDRVQAGQVIALLDNSTQGAQVASARAAALAAQAQAAQSGVAADAVGIDQRNAVAVATRALQAARIDAATARENARIAVSQAKTDLAKTVAGPRPQEIAQAEQTVNQARATRNQAIIDRDRAQHLFDKGFVARSQVDAAQTSLSVDEATLSGAEQALALQKAGNRSEDVTAARLRLSAAQAVQRQAGESGAAHIAQAQAALRQAVDTQRQVEAKRLETRGLQDAAVQKQADLQNAQANSAFNVIRAPLSGIVTRRLLNPGDMTDGANPIVEIGDPTRLDLVASLPADTGKQVRVGQTVRIISPDSASGAATGQVQSVGAVDPATNLLAVRVRVTGGINRVKAGQFVTAQIIVESRPHAVVVPKEAVLAHEGGDQIVYTVGADSVAHSKTVTVGAEQDGLIEIVRGLSPGTTVVKVGQYELTDGAKTRKPEAEGAKDDKSGDAKADDAKPAADAKAAK